MKLKKRILIILAVTILSAAGTAAVWQRNTLEALSCAATMESDEILEKIQENDEILQQVMREYNLRGEDLSEEDIEKLQTGEMTEEEAIAKLIAKSEPAESVEAPTASKPTTGTEVQQSTVQQSSSDVDAAVQKQIARMYALKAQYLGQVEGVVASVQAQYHALPKEQRTAAAKQSLISSGISRIAGLEGQCDGQVAAVVSELRSILSNAGRSTSLADQVQAAYSREKSLKKAYYASQMK